MKLHKSIFHSEVVRQIQFMGDYNISSKVEGVPVKNLKKRIAIQKRPLGTRQILITDIKPDEMAYWNPN